jgi:hypothetical protein
MVGKTGGPESTATRLFGGNLLPAHCDLANSVPPFSGQNLAFCLLTGTKSGFWVNTAALKFATLSGMGATPELSDRLCAELFKPLYRQKSLNGAALSCV